MPRSGLLGCIVTLLITVPSAAGEKVVEGALGKKLDTTVQRTTGEGYWGVVLVAREGKILLAKGYGYADYASQPNLSSTRTSSSERTVPSAPWSAGWSASSSIAPARERLRARPLTVVPGAPRSGGCQAGP